MYEGTCHVVQFTQGNAVIHNKRCGQGAFAEYVIHLATESQRRHAERSGCHAAAIDRLLKVLQVDADKVPKQRGETRLSDLTRDIKPLFAGQIGQPCARQGQCLKADGNIVNLQMFFVEIISDICAGQRIAILAQLYDSAQYDIHPVRWQNRVFDHLDELKMRPERRWVGRCRFTGQYGQDPAPVLICWDEGILIRKLFLSHD